MSDFMLTELERKIQADEFSTLTPPDIRTLDKDGRDGPQSPDFMMMSGGIARTAGGRLWICWTGGGDDETAFFLAAWSDDEGKTWTPPRYVIRAGPSPHGFNRSICGGNFWVDSAGRLHWIFDYRMGSFDGRCGTWTAVCENPDDSAPEWSTPYRIAHGAAMGKPLILSDGTRLLGISLWERHRIYGFPGQTWAYDQYDGDYTRELDPERKAWVYAVNAAGTVWTRRGGAAAAEREFDEQAIIEKSDGTLLMYLRTYYGIAETFSQDQGWTWSEPTPSYIKHPPARIFLQRLDSGKWLMVRHAVPDGAKPARNNLTAYLSCDEGESWYGGLTLDDREPVSYPDGFQHPDGRIFVTYDHRRKDGSLQLAVFTEKDVEAGRKTTAQCQLRRLVMCSDRYNG